MGTKKTKVDKDQQAPLPTGLEWKRYYRALTRAFEIINEEPEQVVDHILNIELAKLKRTQQAAVERWYRALDAINKASFRGGSEEACLQVLCSPGA